MVFGRKFSRGRSGRTALFRSLIRALVLSGKIVTTKARAKAITGQIDKYVSQAQKGGVSLRRKVLAKMGNDRETVDKLFGKVAQSFTGRKSGFTRTTLLPRRKGDNAEMAILEWVEKIADKQSLPLRGSEKVIAKIKKSTTK
ncbi:MAG: 50S ribosomal protein L17 [bacterium]|nr:50S ribosomal protein L17 [bacterium]